MANANVTTFATRTTQMAPRRAPTTQHSRHCDFSNLRKDAPGAVDGALSVLAKHIDGHFGGDVEFARSKFHELVGALNRLSR